MKATYGAMFQPAMKPIILLLLVLFAACSQKQPLAHKSAAVESAERLERRATAAFVKGDLLSAAKDYQVAASVYESLAMQDELAVTQLNLARIENESGRKPHAQSLVEEVLRKASTGAPYRPATLLIANGRAAAFAIGAENWPAAAAYLDTAQAMCQSGCDAVSALLVLRSEWMLATNDTAGAQVVANQAFERATNPSDKANALRAKAQVAMKMNAYQSAITEASAALQIDQEQGASSRVIADLALLSQAHSEAGNASQAAQYKALEQKAQKARDWLHAK